MVASLGGGDLVGVSSGFAHVSAPWLGRMALGWAHMCDSWSSVGGGTSILLHGASPAG